MVLTFLQRYLASAANGHYSSERKKCLSPLKGGSFLFCTIFELILSFNKLAFWAFAVNFECTRLLSHLQDFRRPREILHDLRSQSRIAERLQGPIVHAEGKTLKNNSLLRFTVETVLFTPEFIHGECGLTSIWWRISMFRNNLMHDCMFAWYYHPCATDQLWRVPSRLYQPVNQSMRRLVSKRVEKIPGISRATKMCLTYCDLHLDWSTEKVHIVYK